MNSKETILCIASTSWRASFVQSTVQLMSLLAKDNKVIFVESAPTLKDFVWALLGKNKLDIKRNLGLKSRFEKITTEYGTELELFHPPVILTINFINNNWLFNALNKFNASLITKSLSKNLAKQNISQLAIVNAWNPFHGINMVAKFNEKKLFYYCYDEMSASKWIGKHGSRYEEAFMSQCDGVIVTSKNLQKNKKEHNSNCFLVQNGVNFELFNNYLQANPKVESSSNNIGYIGAIDDRLDYDLLEMLFKSFSNFTFTFVGKISNVSIKEKLALYSNVNLVSAVPAASLPAYVNSFDVCIIPFVTNEFTKNIYPMKINEYLAMGKAVVSTNFSNLEEFVNTCTICNTHNDFADALINSLNNNDKDKVEKRIAVAKENSWTQRAILFENIIFNRSS